jgi:hypothetical protein
MYPFHGFVNTAFPESGRSPSWVADRSRFDSAPGGKFSELAIFGNSSITATAGKQLHVVVPFGVASEKAASSKLQC